LCHETYQIKEVLIDHAVHGHQPIQSQLFQRKIGCREGEALGQISAIQHVCDDTRPHSDRVETVVVCTPMFAELLGLLPESVHLGDQVSARGNQRAIRASFLCLAARTGMRGCGGAEMNLRN
jgi:hypothetical protein